MVKPETLGDTCEETSQAFPQNSQDFHLDQVSEALISPRLLSLTSVSDGPVINPKHFYVRLSTSHCVQYCQKRRLK